jgi:hypothetical protein
MQDEVEDKLDMMLRAHLKRELDPHIGSALSRFDAEIRPALDRPMAIGTWQSRVRYAAAAVVMLGVGVVGSVVYHNTKVQQSTTPIATETKSIPFTDAVQSSWTQTYDGGTVMVDPQTPARMLRRVQYEKTEWKDASGKWQSRIDIPHEDVILVDMPKQ